MAMGHSAYGVAGAGAGSGPSSVLSDQIRWYTPTLLSPLPRTEVDTAAEAAVMTYPRSSSWWCCLWRIWRVTRVWTALVVLCVDLEWV